MASDKRIKNEGALIARTVERIAGESTAATTPKHHAATKSRQATGIGMMLQELSESLNACVQEQKEENKRFWTCFLHLKAQKHQFSMYIKSKHADFPKSLLQQFNFQSAKEIAPAKESEEAETEGESEEKQQQEKEAAEDDEEEEEA